MKVAIIGTGISGLTLALRLQQLGIETSVHTVQTPDELRGSRVENLVARFPATQRRERQLGCAFWDDVEGFEATGIDVDVVGTPLGFVGRFAEPSQGVDFRVYLSRLLETYIRRGGRARFGPLPADEDDLVARTAGHDTVVVAAGREAPVGRRLFTVDPERTPYGAPQRRLAGGFFTGVAPDDRLISFNIIPGAGEIFRQPFLTARGVVSAMLVEAIPEGPLDAVASFDLRRGAGAFGKTVLAAVREHAPNLAARIDASSFAPLGERDVLQGAVTPVVRRNWARLRDGRIALAIGDAWIANDPITGQGANTGSHCAWHVAEHLAASGAPTENDAMALEQSLRSYADPVTAWTNAFLQPPPPHVLDLLGAATANPAVADAFAQGFADPVSLATRLATPEGCATLITEALDPVAV